LCLALCARADETISLVDYLTLANQQGYQVVYSSALVQKHFNVTHNPDVKVSLEALRFALKAYDLALVTLGEGGFVVQRQPQPLSAPLEQSASKQITPSAIEEIVVSSSLHQVMMGRIDLTVRLGREDLAKRPVVANDVFRVGNRLPGAATNGVSSRARVRGGRENETLIDFNGMRLYEPFHLNRFNSLFSVIDSRTVDSVDFVTGGFPVTHGDRLSGVMSIRTLPAEDLGPVSELGVGLYTASFLQSGGRGDHHYYVNLRRSTVDLLEKVVERGIGKPAFSDLYAVYQRNLGDDTLTANVLWFGDDVSINNTARTESARSMYGNTYIWLTHDRMITKDRSSTLNLGFTAIKNDRDGYTSKPGMVTGSLRDDQEFRVYSVSYDLKQKGVRHLLELGGVYRYLDAEYGFDSTLDINPEFIHLSNYARPSLVSVKVRESGQQLAFYLNYRSQLLDRLYLETGLRADRQDYTGKSWSSQISPRASLLYRFPGSGGELRWSLGEFAQAQGIHELDISDGEALFQRAQKAYHHVISYQLQFDQWQFRIEAYRKRTNRTSPYFENLTDPISLVPELQVDRTRVAADHVRAQGVEFSIDGELHGNDLWLNYTRSRVDENIGTRDVPRSWDQTHAANVGWARKVRNWQTSFEATYHSGWPITRFDVTGSRTIEAGLRNSVKLPYYLSVDFKATRSWQWQNSKALRLEVGVSNLLNRANQIGIEYEMLDGQLTESHSLALPIAPFVDVFLQF
jgi:hypothetical protein